MKLLTYLSAGVPQLGVVTANGVLDVGAAVGALGLDAPSTPDALYSGGLEALARLQSALGSLDQAAYTLDEATLTLAPVVPNPGKILCVGLNYRKHAEESNMAAPKNPVLFSKFNNALAAPNEPIPLAAAWEQVDYEAELVVVVGKRAKNVSVADALGYVLGYCNGDDISERYLQFLSGQWLLGKTSDKFLPIGPYVVTADEVPDPQALTIQGWCNGELRQNSSTADMIFSVAEVIAYASRHFTLEAGDIISTGTPEGVVFGMKEKRWIKPGDEYTVEVAGLGRLTNRFVAE
ncbi:MAG: fumarylacetoacetate hydrolase family protein [Phototrophicaceae bacterium]|jgi:2-keto-4-pentenoate hydratase/2-oxohepta-3-ene-1,7-dioic acid hydratase in catechol pathway